MSECLLCGTEQELDGDELPVYHVIAWHPLGISFRQIKQFLIMALRVEAETC